MYYENYILINIEIPNFEEIKKKYFDNDGNKIVLINDNYSIQSPFEYITPVMNIDENGTDSEVAKEIFGGIVATGLLALSAVAVLASGGALLVPVLAGAAIGAGANLLGQGISNLISGQDFFSDINWFNVGLGALTGAAFATGFGGIWGAIGIGDASNSGMSALEGNSWLNIGFSGVVGGVSAFVGFKIGQYSSNKLLNIDTTLGVDDYIKMAKIDGASIFKQVIVALSSRAYTLGPIFASGISRGIMKFIGNKIGDLF